MKQINYLFIILITCLFFSCKSYTSDFTDYYEMAMGINKGMDDYISRNPYYQVRPIGEEPNAEYAIERIAQRYHYDKLYEELKESNVDLKELEALHKIIDINFQFTLGLVRLHSSSRPSYEDLKRDRMMQLSIPLETAMSMDVKLGDRYKAVLEMFEDDYVY